MDYNGVASDKREEEEHAEIFLVECSVIFSCMSHDTVLRAAYQETAFDTTCVCGISNTNPFCSFPHISQKALICDFHGLWFIYKDGLPHNEEQRLSLYRKANCPHLIQELTTSSIPKGI
jgi:CDGSH-type Zn-finger protein